MARFRSAAARSASPGGWPCSRPMAAAIPSRALPMPMRAPWQVRQIGDNHLDCWLQDAAGGRVRARGVSRARSAARPGAAGGHRAQPMHFAGRIKLDRWQGELRVTLPDRGRRGGLTACFCRPLRLKAGPRPHRLEVRTPPFQGGNPGSIPGGDASISAGFSRSRRHCPETAAPGAPPCYLARTVSAGRSSARSQHRDGKRTRRDRPAWRRSWAKFDTIRSSPIPTS